MIEGIREVNVDGEIIDLIRQKRQGWFWPSDYGIEMKFRSGKQLFLVPQNVDRLHFSLYLIAPGKEPFEFHEKGQFKEGSSFAFDFGRSEFKGLWVISSHTFTESLNSNVNHEIVTSNDGPTRQLTKTSLNVLCVPMQMDGNRGKAHILDPTNPPSDFKSLLRVQISIIVSILELPLYKLEAISLGELLPGFIVTDRSPY